MPSPQGRSPASPSPGRQDGSFHGTVLMGPSFLGWGRVPEPGRRGSRAAGVTLSSYREGSGLSWERSQGLHCLHVDIPSSTVRVS